MPPWDLHKMRKYSKIRASNLEFMHLNWLFSRIHGLDVLGRLQTSDLREKKIWDTVKKVSTVIFGRSLFESLIWDLQKHILAGLMIVKSSSEILSKTNQTVAIRLDRLQCRLQDHKNGKNGQNFAIWPQKYY